MNGLHLFCTELYSDGSTFVGRGRTLFYRIIVILRSQAQR